MNIHLKLFFPNAPLRHTTIEFTKSPTLQSVLTKLQTQHNLPSFVRENQVLPHFLILVNDVQYELKGPLTQTLQDEDTITLLSLVHGGSPVTIWISVSNLLLGPVCE
ncbi:MAG: MoaD/ThiS family protein [Candidatus Ranarchaeia archaeon]|jgi:hypothetical protein